MQISECLFKELSGLISTKVPTLIFVVLNPYVLNHLVNENVEALLLWQFPLCENLLAVTFWEGYRCFLLCLNGWFIFWAEHFSGVVLINQSLLSFFLFFPIFNTLIRGERISVLALVITNDCTTVDSGGCRMEIIRLYSIIGRNEGLLWLSVTMVPWFWVWSIYLGHHLSIIEVRCVKWSLCYYGHMLLAGQCQAFLGIVIYVDRPVGIENYCYEKRWTVDYSHRY